MSNRREYLGALATGLAVAAGGCLSDGEAATEDDESDDDPTDSETAAGEPTDTATAEETETDESGEATLEGTIDITGSGTVYPLAQAVVEEFIQQHPEVSISLAQTGTGGGFSQRFCTGDADFSNASRPISAAERDQCADNGVEAHEIRLAVDAVTVVVNADNDWVDCVTTDELREIWRTDGATRWSDVRDEWPDEAIERYGPADTSGTFDYVDEAVVGAGTTHTRNYASAEAADTIVQAVEFNQYAIGYVGFAYYRNNSDAVSAVAVDDGRGCVEPSLETAASGEYPFARPLFTYVNADRLGETHIAAFARYVVEQSANEELVAEEIGYVPNSEARIEEELDALNEVISGQQ